MSRIPLVPTDPESPVLRERFTELQGWGFPLMNVVRMFANHETFFGGFVEMIRALYVEGKLSPRHRELGYLRASQINGCHY
jgi:Carboxymuconolactone decarboxylase family